MYWCLMRTVAAPKRLFVLLLLSNAIGVVNVETQPGRDKSLVSYTYTCSTKCTIFVHF